MKTLVMTTALLMLATIAFTQEKMQADSNNIVFEGKHIKCVMYPSNNDMITMILEKEPGEKVNLRIKQSDSEILYQKRMNNVDKARVKFDISDFPSGEYTFELVRGNKVLYTKNFAKKDETVAFVK